MNVAFNENNKAALKREDFQKEIDGKKTDLFILTNSKGHELAFTNYGGAIAAIMMPDKNGNYGNVILGHDSIEHVVKSPEPFLSTLIGRYGNRICKGKFNLDGKEYTLPVNNGVNHLHGGPEAFNTKVWDAEQLDEHRVKLHYVSKDGEEGFPGMLDMTVIYTFTDDDEFIIEYEGHTDAPTIVNMPHHGFYNLAGISNPSPTVDNVVCEINADYFVPIDETSIPTGEIVSVKGTPFDFTAPHAVGDDINDLADEQIKNGTGYDHCYVLNKNYPGELTFAAKIKEPASGRTMEVYTTEPGVQVYTGNWLNGFAGAHGATFPARSAICFEAQHFPDSPNRPYFPSVVLRPGETYKQKTIYKFGVEK